MNLMGKILTLLIFFLSICFLVIAVMVGAAHQNWQAQATENKKVADRNQDLLDTARVRSGEMEKQLNAERVARTLQLSQLESQLSQARETRDAKEKDLANEQIKAQQLLETTTNNEKRLTEQDQELAILKTGNNKLVDDIAAQRQSVVNLTNQLYQAKAAEESLKTMNQDLSQSLAQKQKVMKAHGLKDDALVDHIPPRVDGRVARVKDDYIAISLGTDDGIREGHTLDIYRNDRFIGKAIVTKADYNMSAARIDKDFLQAPVAEGDYVTTKF